MRSFTKRSFTLFAAGLLLASTSIASAAERGPGKRGECQGAKRGECDPAKRGERMQKRVTEKLGPSLGLDEAQSQELAAIMKASAEARMAAMKTVRAEREQLRVLVENKAPAKDIEAQRAQVEAAMVAVPSKLDVLASTSRVLNAEQQAKLTLKLSGHERGKRGKKGEGRRGPAAE